MFLVLLINVLSFCLSKLASHIFSVNVSNLDNPFLWNSLYSLFLCPQQMQDKRSDTAGRQTGPARIVMSEVCVGCILASQQEM